MTLARLSRSAGIPLKFANRHGLITGQTGTGKTVSLMTLAEQFSKAGIPVFVADVKGDISALARSCPVQFLDLFGQSGKPIKTTLETMGVDLLARAMELTDSQSGCLEIAFKVAADYDLPLVSLGDLQRVLSTISDNRDTISRTYGNTSPASIGVIRRAILRLESQGGKAFFGNPQYDVADLFDGNRVSILQAVKLIESPRIYAAFLLWLLSEMQSRLPEIGDCAAPRMMFFFDEAHLIFQDCPPHLLRRIEQTVRLIRSKGVGVYFVSQMPGDIPDLIRSQLAHRVRHDRSMQIGTAEFETMNESGNPAPPQVVKVTLPDCRLGALDQNELRPFVPAPETVKAQSGVNRGELIIYGAAFAAIVATGVGLYALVTAYGAGKIAAATIGILVASVLKK